MTRRVVILVACAILVGVAIIAVRVTSDRFDDSGEDAPTVATQAPSTAVVTPDRSDEAAANYGWQLTDSDDFDGRRVDKSRWNVYHGYNETSGETLSEDQCVVRGGTLTLVGNGDDTAATCGIAWREDQTYGRWEVRARFPAPADHDFNPVLLLWPESDTNQDGEIDFAEIYDPARQFVESWLHGPGNIDAGHTKKDPVDITQWHNYAVEWQPDHVTCYLDGVAWATYGTPGTIPDQPMHLVIQQNHNRHKAEAPIRSTAEIDWVRLYE
ncbi:licheninase [Amycolatopsis endophytica]|uniref:Licheninase n=1 Tax=Amycolatopsis endophytica TaxID=860233 RepID=A0A853BCJ7_9PSEU|nr:glycoside hydrolase family 16 protein [Amycolatopsis endophytica]NYI92505.1 licheninase [Amycolatopsis endophytica]